MAKVKNLSGRVLPIHRWRVLPDSRVLDPLGNAHCCLPDEIAYSKRGKSYADQKLLAIHGYMVPGVDQSVFVEKKAVKPGGPTPVMPAPPPEPEPDDLTVLVHIGKGRARKLEEAGITAFAALAEISPEDLGNFLDIAKDAAEEILADAKSKMG